jgi:hypothetical protein
LGNEVQISVANYMLANPKVPFDNTGIEDLKQAFMQPLQAAKEAGILAADAEITVTAPTSSQVTAADRTARRLDSLSGVVRYSGAIHNVVINLTVTI